MLAAQRAEGMDIDADADAARLHLCLSWVLFGKRYAGTESAASSWYSIASSRLERLLAGGFEVLFTEGQEGYRPSACTELGPGVGPAAKARRASELAHLGSAGKALGALTAGGTLPLEEVEVQTKFASLMSPNSEPPPA